MPNNPPENAATKEESVSDIKRIDIAESRVPCCDGHHAMGCCDDPPWTVCCWRCTVNPSASPEAFRAAMRTSADDRQGRGDAADRMTLVTGLPLPHDEPGLTPCGDDECRVCWSDDA